MSWLDAFLQAGTNGNLALSGNLSVAGTTSLAGLGGLTDSTGGTPGTTLAAIAAGSSYSQADLVAVKNALATLAAQVNKL
jgi:hypothetical protein